MTRIIIAQLPRRITLGIVKRPARLQETSHELLLTQTCQAHLCCYQRVRPQFAGYRRPWKLVHLRPKAVHSPLPLVAYRAGRKHR